LEAVPINKERPNVSNTIDDAAIKKESNI